jgi:Putative auto-transporter adhesin, head GIN domain
MNFIAKTVLVLLVLALAIGAAAYGFLSANVKQSGTQSGTINLAAQNLSKETRPVTAEIEQVEMNGPFDLAIVRGDKASMTLQGEGRLLPKVVVQQDGKVLRISTKGMLVTNNQTVKIVLMVPNLTSLTQSGSGDSEVDGFNGPGMTLSLNGSGDLTYAGQHQHLVLQSRGGGNMDLDVGTINDVEITSDGSGNIVAIGKAKKIHTLATGTGTVDTERLISQQAEVISHGTGTVKVYANKSADITSTGTGDVEIYGNPADKKIVHTGAGEVSSN